MLPPWLADPGLLPLWRLVHARLEQRGSEWRGRATLAVASESERSALRELLGTPVRTGRVVVDVGHLAELTVNAGGLLAVVTDVVGPVVDRRSERETRAQDRQALVRAARRGLGDASWVEEWCAFVRRSQPPPADVLTAVSLLRRLVDGQEPVARQDLAASLCGDAHALDDAMPLAALVLRGLALALDVPPAQHARARRELWEAAGVRLDSVSATALTLSLPGFPEGRPRHLMARDVVDVGRASVVFVCENPRVLEACADAAVPLPVVCTSGNPNLVVLDVLRRLRSAGAVLHYHGDFDWPGLAMADRLVAALGARPFRMEAEDYLDAPASVPLQGRSVAASWAPDLTAAMVGRGLVVHEEAVLGSLMGALAALVH